MAGTKFKTSITKDGPFFRHDPRQTFRANVRELIRRVIAEGERDIVGQLRSGQGGRARIRKLGRVSDYVEGRVTAITGKEWQVTGVVSVNTAGLGRSAAVAVRAAGSTLERRHHAFRRTTSRLRRARAVNQAALLEGLQ